MAEGVSLGKGAWDCDNNVEIPPEKEAEVFEEIATMGTRQREREERQREKEEEEEEKIYNASEREK